MLGQIGTGEMVSGGPVEAHPGRPVELSLLGYGTVIYLLGGVLFALAGQTGAGQSLPGAVGLAGAFVLTHFWLTLTHHRGDQLMLPLIGVLSALGEVELYRLSPALAIRQFWWICLGLVVLIVLTRWGKNYRNLSEYRYLFMAVVIILLVMTIVFGVTIGGARNWLSLGSFRFQPSEGVKILLVLFLTGFLDENRELLATGTRRFFGFQLPEPRYLGPLLLTWGITLLLLVFQRDLGTALIFFATFLVMVYIATSRGTYVGWGLALFLAGSATAYFLFPHVQERFAVWLNPWGMQAGGGYQVVQSLFAIGSGGLVGTGIGLGQPFLIPAVATDFIYAAVVEEMGLAGGIGVLLVYLLLIYRGYRTALAANSPAGMILAAGITSLLAIQTFVIVAGVTRLLPLTGITLPFISYGGSSMVANFALIGLLLNVSQDTARRSTGDAGEGAPS